MTIPDPIDARPITTDEEVLDRARGLVQQAYRRQLWLMLIDAERMLLPVLPRIDIPREPDGFAVRHLADRMRELAREVGARELAVVYERPGSERLTFSDRRWLRLIAARPSTGAVPLRGPLFAHARGVRWVGAEDLDDPPVPAERSGSGAGPPGDPRP